MYRHWLRAGIAVAIAGAMSSAAPCQETAFRPINLTSTIDAVQPLAGIVYWTTNPRAATDPIQYVGYDQIVGGKGVWVRASSFRRTCISPR